MKCKSCSNKACKRLLKSSRDSICDYIVGIYCADCIAEAINLLEKSIYWKEIDYNWVKNL